MKKFKMLMISMLLSFCVFNVVETNVLNIDNSVHAALPTFTMGADGKLTASNINSHTTDKFFEKVLTEYRDAIVFVSGIGTLSMILFFILNFIKLGNSQGNPQERQKAITGLIFAGISTACLGSITLVASMFYGLLK